MPSAGVALAGTSRDRPLLPPEGELIGRETGLDFVLLRLDAERGVSFDVFLQERQGWLCRHDAWRRNTGACWLISEAEDGPVA